LTHALADRTRAAEDRARAGRDRERSRRDRALAARDRERAAGDRRRAAKERRLAALQREQSGIDELTGARRRGIGLEELEAELQRSRRTGTGLVAGYVDVDGLKRVNDEHGHSAGDSLLQAVATRLRRQMRSYDLLVRLGGDEFLCVMPGVSLEAAQQRFAEVGSELEREGGNSISVGFALLEDGDSAAELMQRADRDLLARRARGRAARPGA
jgi:diguanylate cyclase (GGDEF)-like protein